MNLIEALKSGRPLRRTGRTFSYQSPVGLSERTYIHPDAWLDPKWFLETVHLTADDILADNWEIREPEVTITRAQLFAAYAEALQEAQFNRRVLTKDGSIQCWADGMDPLTLMAKNLGLDPAC